MKRLVIPVLVALCCAIGAASTNAAYYEGSREVSYPLQPDIHIEITVRDRYIVRAEGRFPTRCRPPGQGNSFFSYDRLHARIGADGRFRWRREYRDGDYRAVDAMVGRLDGRVIRARFASRFAAFVGDRCWSGRSYGDPWVRIVARRQRRS